MLKYNPEHRLSAKEAYQHQWISSKKFNELSPETAKTLMTNLKNFSVFFISYMLFFSVNRNYSKQH